jgi:Protein of unknown function (DUF1573)
LNRTLLKYLSVMLVALVPWPAGKVLAQGWAQKMVSELSHDFGDVARGTSPEHVFEIENCYEENMVIEYVRSSCGCTKVSVDRQLLGTWEKARLVAKFDTMAYSGRREATIAIGFAHPFAAEVKLTVRGNILTDVQVHPARLDFGTLAPGNSPPQSVTLTRRNNSRFRITDVRSTFPHVAVSFQELRRDGGEVVYVLQAWLKEGIPAGQVLGELNVIGEDGISSSREIRIPVQFNAKVITPLQISPAVLNIANAVIGQPVTRRVLLKADLPFRIEDVMCDDRSFTVKADQDAKPVHFVEVTYHPASGATAHETVLQFITDLDSQPRASLPAVVSVSPAMLPTEAGTEVVPASDH